MNPKAGLRILLVEDNEDDVVLIRESLRQTEAEFALECAPDLASGLERIANGGVDIVLLDLGLPDSNGFDTFLKVNASASKLPVVLLTHLHDEALAIQAVQRGAQDYLIKGEPAAAPLARVLRYAVERKRLERLQDELIHNINHELKNPISAVYGALVLLSEEAAPMTEEQRQLLVDIALKGAKHLMAMVGDLLDATRLQAGKLIVEPTRIHIKETIDEGVSILKEKAAQAGIALSAEVPDGLPPVFADPKRVLQILTNLIDNAIKFAPRGGSIIVRAVSLKGMGSGTAPSLITSKEEVRADRTKLQEGFVRISVMDTGCGMEPEETGRIFERLYQAASHNLSGSKGLGIGLYLCKQLILQQGGDIWVESRPGRGSTFFFTIPLCPGEAKTHAG